MRRLGLVVRIRPEKVDEYGRLHAAVLDMPYLNRIFFMEWELQWTSTDPPQW